LAEDHSQNFHSTEKTENDSTNKTDTSSFRKVKL